MISEVAEKSIKGVFSPNDVVGSLLQAYFCFLLFFDCDCIAIQKGKKKGAANLGSARPPPTTPLLRLTHSHFYLVFDTEQ